METSFLLSCHGELWLKLSASLFRIIHIILEVTHSADELQPPRGRGRLSKRLLRTDVDESGTVFEVAESASRSALVAKELT